ncbi:redox-sensing transcriptional repressor Rex [Phototrophicus methaneseepsis]|uniref:Redox-sensing transcriptional repressor Rex n=1 Tax=Phototrophicus methaneseepsis TaxID=2710758 RepID=A0A7S8E6Y7_9CHLR|nr:redox-sensing transcriptional repressor Rex [Phototrophicus methaneseepsis]QPC81469.1 redox-sensing transcriptional repressor Rex [Phototrophicus methaneseepsis]
MPLKLENRIPDIVIGRLPLYLRALNRLKQEGIEVTSSHELGQRLGISSAQIRKDLSHFGGFGKQGTGYQINFLITKLQSVLKINQRWQVAVVGAGNLGSAISHYRGFQDRGFEIAWLFDADESKIGQQVGRFTVQAISELKKVISENKIQIAMVAVPAEQAQEVADILVDAGIRAILNYAPINLTVPDHVMVQYIDPVVHMQHMTYYLDENA